MNQLTAVYGTNPESYSYNNGSDLNGNRNTASSPVVGSQTYGAPGPANRLTTVTTSAGTLSYTYDAVGNVVSESGTLNGVTVSYSFTYDYRNRLTQVVYTNGNTTTTDNFTYDVFNRRIGKITTIVVGHTLTQISPQLWTVYDGANPYADFQGTTLKTRYVYGNGVDQLLARTNASGNSTAWYLTDQLGSVRAIVSIANGVLYQVAYDSYGNIRSQSGSGGDRFGYTGREWDSEIGLYYYRARYYDPNTGRFISEDPIQFGGGDPNLYRYVGNSPGNFRDPSGKIISFGTTLAGAGIGGVGGLFYGLGHECVSVVQGNSWNWTNVGKDTLIGVGTGGTTGAILGACGADPSALIVIGVGETMFGAAGGGFVGGGIDAGINQPWPGSQPSQPYPPPENGEAEGPDEWYPAPPPPPRPPRNSYPIQPPPSDEAEGQWDPSPSVAPPPPDDDWCNG